MLASIPEEDRFARPAPQMVTQETVLRERDRRGLSAAQKFAAHERYGWRCQYCGRRVVIAGVLELVGRLCPEVRWWPNDNMPKPLTHPAAERLYPNADHIKARATGGHATADDNLICSCTTCNERKGSREGWQPIVTSEPWDGCVPLFAPLYDLARAERATLTKAIVDWLDAAGQAHAATAAQSSQPAPAPCLPHPIGATAAWTRKRPQASLDEKLMNAGADVLDAAERLRVLGDEIGLPVVAEGGKPSDPRPAGQRRSAVPHLSLARVRSAGLAASRPRGRDPRPATRPAADRRELQEGDRRSAQHRLPRSARRLGDGRRRHPQPGPDSS
jgi:hypothetical protein